MIPTAPQYPEISGYTITDLLYLGSRTAVYRAIDNAQQFPVVIKVLQREYPTFGELVQFRNQYAITKNLNIPGIAQPLSLDPYRNGYALVMEDFGGISLRQFTQGKSLKIEQFLPIAVQITDILHQIHQQRVIHKDLKPANILIHPDSKQVKLIDFSIASLLPRETQEIQNPNGLEGTLAYLSPEQTGRMNRGIDYRSDFYSLGITFFELLTGQLPFQTDNPMELVHSHLAKQPPFVCDINPDLPPVLSQIIHKLMAKNAEDRYQTALGLKYDLQQCLTQWKETGAIAAFELAQRDLCDRFNIPEKLYGRESEVQALLDAFDRVTAGNSEMMLVAGFSGIGKTAVINEVHKPITRQRGYFIKGKFDQFNRNIPLSAFVQAFRGLMGQLLSESDQQLQQWKTQILQAVGDSGQVLIEVIPELENIIGTQPPVPELSGSAAQNRFNLLLQKFIAIFTTQDHPLVMFLDDLQWADSASLKLLNLLMAESETGYLLVLGAYRDNEVFPGHPLMLTLEDIRKHQAQIHTLILKPLAETHIHQLVADTLLCTTELAAPLAELVYQKTRGNPFFTTQFLQGLYEENCITFEATAGYWQCNLAQIRQLALTDDVVEFMVMRLRKLPEATQEVLKLAACIGNRFDLQTLSVVCDYPQEQIAADLWQSLQEGLVIPDSETYKFFQQSDGNTENISNISISYQFLHDRVQQAASSLIPQNQKEITHLNIGRSFVNNIPQDQWEERIFDFIDHWNLGRNLIVTEQEIAQLVHLNVLAGRHAKLATAYNAALSYFEIGIELLSPHAWQTQYHFTLSLYENAAEAAYLSGETQQQQSYIQTVIKQAKNILDRVNVHQVEIESYIAQKQPLEAIQLGLNILQQLGTTLPSTPTIDLIQQAITDTIGLLTDINSEDLLNLPAMTDTKSLAALKTMWSIVPAIVISSPVYFPLIACEEVRLSIQSGSSPFLIGAYADFATTLGLVCQDIEQAYEFAKLTITETKKTKENLAKSSALYKVVSFTIHRKIPLRETLPLLLEGYHYGLESGDVGHASYCIKQVAQYSYLSGQNLQELQKTATDYHHAMTQLKQENALSWHEPLSQSVNALLQGKDDIISFLNIPFNKEEEAKDRLKCFYFSFHRLILSYLIGDRQKTLFYIDQTQEFMNTANGFFNEIVFHFYASLTHLSHGNNDLVEESREKLKTWAIDAPMNCQHKYDLVEAERYRVLGDKTEAIELYDRAIAGAKENKYIQEEALANELAAKFYLSWGFDSAQPNGKEKVATGYMIEAYYCYSRWGAKAKIDDLQQRYPHLLRPILQAAELSTGNWNTRVTISPLTASNHSITHNTSNQTSINQALDFTAILNASQALSSTIDLDKLLHQLTQIILQNSGADRCALILPNKSGEWQVRAIATLDNTQLCAQPLANHPHLPVKLIQYVKNTQEIVVIDDLKTDLPVIDRYLRQRQPKSILCLPLLNQGQLIGILDLKSHFTIGAFTRDRVEVLNFLCTQAAISLENARLYQQSQDYAAQLEQSHLQVVQSEKMASLGGLVAGVAHEINNPLGFLNGSINNGKDYVQDLLEYLETYHQQQPPTDEVKQLAEEIDLDFLLEDLPQLLDSMRGATERIKGISTSLRTFSRADTEHKVSANLDEGLDSTLLILKYRLKANEHRPAIQVTTDYGDLPLIECFPGQLNQVFMNILANAIDMFDEMAQTQSFKQLEANPQQITIRTQIESNQVYIRIRDNGKGMSQEVKAKIFKHLFTTKAVGKGTGLGLAIARQIVVEKHGGSLDVWSEPGQGTEFCIRFPALS